MRDGVRTGSIVTSARMKIGTDMKNLEFKKANGSGWLVYLDGMLWAWSPTKKRVFELAEAYLKERRAGLMTD